MAQTTIVFDTHQAFQQLTEAGVPAEQAQAHVRLHADTIEQTFVTKADLDNLRTELQAEIAKASTSTIKWLCSFQLGTAALVVAVIKLL